VEEGVIVTGEVFVVAIQEVCFMTERGVWGSVYDVGEVCSVMAGGGGLVVGEASEVVIGVVCMRKIGIGV
jgi:hypothetical protein